MSPIRIRRICSVVDDGFKAQLLPIQSTKNIRMPQGKENEERQKAF